MTDVEENHRKANSKLLFDKRRSDYQVIKTALNNPRLYISIYCDEIRNRIDLATIELEKKLVSESKLTEEIFSSQEAMINQVKMFEKDCLSELGKKGTNDLIIGDEIQNMINAIEQKTDAITDSMDISAYDDINRLMENFIYHVQEMIFIKEGLVFMSSEEMGEIYEEARDQYNKLFIVKDIFVSHDLISDEM